MTTAPERTAPGRTATPAPPQVLDVEIVVPVHNEEHVLAASVRRLHDYLDATFPLSWSVTIVDNASTDRTWAVACSLGADLDRVRAVHLDRKGRGLALRRAWSASAATVAAYMDVDLSTDLDALLPLVAPLLSGHSDVAIGSRLAPGARVVRGAKREVISRCYNLVLLAALHTRFSDAQCGFKAIRTDVARRLLPLVQDDGWFFDTELLVLAERNGLRIHEVPVDWVDDPDSRVDIPKTAADDLRGVARLMSSSARSRGVLPDERPPQGASDGDTTSAIVSAAAAGAASAVTFAAVFALLFAPLGAAAADVVALVVCSVADAARRRRRAPTVQVRRRRPLPMAAASLLPRLVGLAVLAALQVSGASHLLPDLVIAAALNIVSTWSR